MKTRSQILWVGGALLLLSTISISVGVASFDLQLFSLSRVPRTLAALLAGASMAVAGVIMQLLVRNKFVEPGTTGAAEAAMFGVLIATLITPGMPIIFKMLLAVGCSLLGILGFLGLARSLPPDQPLLIPLVGLIYSGVIGAGVTYIAYQADLLQYLGVWMSGEFSGVLAGRYELLWFAGIAAFLAYFSADQLSVVGLGQTAAINLGLNYKQALFIGVITVAVVTALVVVTVGLLPFVGLVVPNIVSRIMGDNLKRSLPLVACLGGGLVLASDIVGRVVRYPYEIPAGTVFGIVGAVLFLNILLRKPSYD